MVKDLKSMIKTVEKGQAPEEITIDDQTIWPNELGAIDYEFFNSNAVIVSDGFLVPFKKPGNVIAYLFDDDGNFVERVPITENTSDEIFYLTSISVISDSGKKTILSGKNT